MESPGLKRIPLYPEEVNNLIEVAKTRKIDFKVLEDLVFPDILNEMKKNEIEDVLLFGGGIIPESDLKNLKQMGVGELFTPGTPTTEVTAFLKKWVDEHPRDLI